MEANEVRKKIVKLMEMKDRAWFESKSKEEAEQVIDKCDRMIRALYSQLANMETS